ncbi:MAG: hypothetical protein HYR90_04165 [Candidatus Andersenbacteria bacterium]|nr:hypothetical protein [Candidatus Andersenbacteria bacterium]MBI3250785.1 hypothetical protein [Candidatus Andersenbacteria bacterium]
MKADRFTLPTPIALVVGLLVIGGAIWYAIDQSGTPRRHKGPALSQDRQEYLEELVAAVEDSNIDTSRWLTIKRQELGFSFPYPEGWEYEELTTEEGTRLVLQPVGKRYFREPQRLYPLVVEVVQDGEQAVAAKYPPEETLAASKASLYGDTASVSLLPNNGAAYVFQNPYQKNIHVIMIDSVDTITGIDEGERAELREITDAIIARVDFFQQ